MRKILFTCLAALGSLSSFAQWTSQATAFAANSRGINQIIILDKNTAWATAYDGTGTTQKIRDFTRTTDGGASWTAGTGMAPNNNYGWSCLAALDYNTAWSMYYRISGGAAPGVIYKTTDGGATWTQQGVGTIYTNAASFPNIIYFWNDKEGVAIGDPINNEFEIYMTSDGGLNWKLVDGANIPNPIAGEFGIVRVFAVKGNIIWFGTNKGRLLKSESKGAKWEVFDTGIPYWVDEIHFKDAMNGWMTMDDVDGGGDHLFMRTTDGGVTWTKMNPPSPYHYGSFTYIPYTVQTLISTGIDFQNYDLGSSYSLDGGDTWVEIDADIQHGVVNFFNNFIGWCGGFNSSPTADGIFKYDGSFVPTGIESLDPSVKFQLYPNPSDGLFYFSFDADNNEPIHLTVTDAAGKIVFNKSYSDKSQTWLRSFDLRELSDGFYFLNIVNKGKSMTHKLIVQ